MEIAFTSHRLYRALSLGFRLDFAGFWTKPSTNRPGRRYEVKKRSGTMLLHSTLVLSALGGRAVAAWLSVRSSGPDFPKLTCNLRLMEGGTVAVAKRSFKRAVRQGGPSSAKRVFSSVGHIDACFGR